MKKHINKLIVNTIVKTFKVPPYLILFLNDNCWMKCRHCWFNETWKGNNLKGEKLSFKELENMASLMKRLHFLSLTGGEAFLRDDVVDIVKMFSEKTKLHRFQIPTSGFDTNLIIAKTEQILTTVKHVPFRVDVSLDGKEDTHDFIRNVKGAYRNAIETIIELNKLKKIYPQFDVGVITTISSNNQYEVDEISDIVRKYHPEGEWMINITRGDTRDIESGIVDIKNYIKAHHLIDKRISEGSYKGHSGHFSASWISAKNAIRRRIIAKIYQNEMDYGICAAGSLGGVIYSNGTIMPCEIRNNSFGNIRDYDYDLSLAWNSGVAKKIRFLIHTEKCKCTQECFWSLSLLLKPKYWPKIAYEKYRIKSNKK